MCILVHVLVLYCTKVESLFDITEGHMLPILYLVDLFQSCLDSMTLSGFFFLLLLLFFGGVPRFERKDPAEERKEKADSRNIYLAREGGEHDLGCFVCAAVSRGWWCHATVFAAATI